MLSQERAPIYEALQEFEKRRVVPFDVPGHKRGRGNPELTQLLGEKCVSMDVNSMKPLDNLCHPVSVIREAEELAAQAFGAAHAFLMVGGTTSAVQAMILSVAKRGEKIILPRNVHRSVMGAMVLCGAVPVYVDPACDDRLGIPLGMRREDVENAIKKHPNAKAVLVNNPTYYGICSDIQAIAKMAHDHGMLCLADEAHGTHFYFSDELPMSAMAAGADMAAVSMHKSGGSLTQSSLLLCGPAMQEGHVRQIINLTQTTSGSYLLLSSLDISRRNLALRGREQQRDAMLKALGLEGVSLRELPQRCPPGFQAEAARTVEALLRDYAVLNSIQSPARDLLERELKAVTGALEKKGVSPELDGQYQPAGQRPPAPFRTDFRA